MTTVITYSRTNSVTYVADNILKSLKDTIRLSGLDPANFVDDLASYMLAVKTWLESEHLKKVILDIYDPKNDDLIMRWDMDVQYSWSAGDGNFWTDTDMLKNAIRKAGVAPCHAKYEIRLRTRPGRPYVPGWSKCDSRSTAGMVRQSLGSTIEHNGLAAAAAYWRKAS